MEDGGAIWFPGMTTLPGGVATRAGAAGGHPHPAATCGPLTHRQATEMTRKISQNMSAATPGSTAQDSVNPFKFPKGPAGPTAAAVGVAAPYQLWQGPGGSYVIPNGFAADQMFYPHHQAALSGQLHQQQMMARTPSPDVDLPTLAALKPLFSLTVEDVCALLRSIEGML